jgi:hypothetical protein
MAPIQPRGGAVMRSAISALAGLALAGSFAFAQPSDGRLKIIHETATLRVAYRTDSRPFSYVDAQGRPVGYTIELCERIARSLEAQLNVGLTIKWVPVDERTRFDAIVNDTADMECGSTTVSLSRMKIVDFSSVVFADSTGILVKSGKELFTFDNMAGKNIGVIAGTTNARVGSGFVPSLAHPGGNITGFHNFEPELSGKWLEILKEVAPEVRRVAFLHHPQTAAHIGFLRAIEAASNSVGVTITAAGARDASEIEPALTAFAREPNGGVIVAPSPITTFRRELIITLARQLDLPARTGARGCVLH